MPNTRPPYALEFRRRMVDLVRSGRDPADLAREFEPSAQAIRNWVAQAGFSEGWYNPVRLHSALGYRSPIRYEHDMQTELQPAKP